METKAEILFLNLVGLRNMGDDVSKHLGEITSPGLEVVITSLNCSVYLKSDRKNDNIDSLCETAYDLLLKVKNSNNGTD